MSKQTNDVGPNADEIKLPTQSLRSGSKVLVIDVALPAGYHLNPAAPQRYKVTVDNEKTATIDSNVASGSSKDLKLPIRVPFILAASGSTNLKVQATLFYCREDNTGTCRIKTLVWQVPVESSSVANAATELKLRARLSAD